MALTLTPEDKLEIRRLARLEAAAVAGRSALSTTNGRYPIGLNGASQNGAFDDLDAREGGNPFA